MGAIILTLGGVSVICAAGFGITTALKWFNEYEYDVAGKMKERKKSEGLVGPKRGGRPHEERLNGLRGEVRN